MKKIRFLIFNSPQKDILLLDDNCEKILKKSFGSYEYISLNTRSNIEIAPFQITKSLDCFFKNFKKTYECSITPAKRNFYSFLKINFIIKFLQKIKYYIESILYLSVIFHYKPKIIITNTDNCSGFEYIDSLINKSIPMITVQNGNRWHSSFLSKQPFFEHYYRPKGYHSCFAALSQIDIDMYKKSGWKCDEYYVVGSLNSDSNFKNKNEKSFFDICVVSESINKRKSTLYLARLLRNFLKDKRLKVAIVLKRSPQNDGFGNYYREINDLFGDFAFLLPNNSNNLGVMCTAEVVLGNFSTALRDVFSLGKKIYPINFDFPELNSYMAYLNMNLNPSQEEFNRELESLLNMNQERYFSKNKKLIDYLGSFPQDKSPSQRLNILIDRKIKNCSF